MRKKPTLLVLLILLASLSTGLQVAQAVLRSITLVYPNGGELLMGGSRYDIEWIASEPGDYVQLLYSLDNGTSWIKIDCVPNPLVIGGNPSYTWEVPSVSSTHCKIKVIWLSSCTGIATVYAVDASDAEFTITPVQIYFSSEGDVKAVLAGGVGEVNLTKSPDSWEYQPSASTDGKKVAFVRAELDAWGDFVGNTSEIWVMDSNGENQVRVTNNDVEDVEPAISPDGTKIVFSRFDATGRFSNLYLFEGWMWSPTLRMYIPLETQLTSGNHQDREPCFSPDGTKVVFSSNRDGRFQLYTLSLANPEDVRRALPGVPPYTERDQRTPDWSPDGKWFACSMEWDSPLQSDIFIADSWGPINTRRVFQLTSTPSFEGGETSPSWSPDSREIAYVKKLTGPDVIPQELWTMKLKIDSSVHIVENELLEDLGYTLIGDEHRIGYPSWRRLEGLRVPDVELEGRVDNSFSARLEVFAGVGPYTWSLLGTLPDGLSFSQGMKYPIDLSSLAFIQGTPREAVKEHRFEVKVVDNLGSWVQRAFTITIRPERDLELTTMGRFLPPAVQGVRYSAPVRFRGGLQPYQVTVESAIYGQDLPEGLTWTQSIYGDQLTVLFDSPPSGLPSGRYKVKVEVVDNFGDVAAGFFDLHVLGIEWNVRDVFGENFSVFVWNLPEDYMESYVTGLSIEAGGIEVNLPILEKIPSRDYLTLIAAYPDFSPWRSLFIPGQSTVMGKLKVKVNFEGSEFTITRNREAFSWWDNVRLRIGTIYPVRNSGFNDTSSTVWTTTCQKNFGWTHSLRYGYNGAAGSPPPSYEHYQCSASSPLVVTFNSDQSFEYTAGVPTSADLTWSYCLGGAVEGTLSVMLIKPDGSEVVLDRVTHDGPTGWNTRSVGVDNNNFAQGGTYKIRLQSRLRITSRADFPIHGYTFRRDRGFRFPNFSSSPIQFEQFAEFFGWRETTFWTPWGREPRPIPWLLWNTIPIGRGGNCTGMSVSAYNIAEDIARTRWTSHPNLPHALERNSWLAEPDEALEDYIRKRQWWVVSMEFIRRFSTIIPARSNWRRYSQRMLEDIEEYGLPCYIVMFHDHTGGAHTVTAYAMEDLPDGRKLVRVYDSNKPFSYKESWDDNSAILIDPSRGNSWMYKMANGEKWGNDWILAVPISLLRGDPNLPGLLDLPELLLDWTFFALIGSAEPTQITDNEGHKSFTPEGELNIDPATGMPYCLPMPFPVEDNYPFGRMYYIPAGTTYQLDISGKKSGKYDFLYMPMDEMLINFNVDTSVGSKDNITFKPQELSATFSTPDSKKFCYRMAREFENERMARMFTLDNIEIYSGNITITTTSEGDVIIIRNDGAATSYDLRVEYLLENEDPQTFERKDVSLGGGETQRITPTSWEALSTAEVNVEIDQGSDGSWDENIKLLSEMPEKEPPEEKPPEEMPEKEPPEEKPPKAKGLELEVIVGITLAAVIAIGLFVFLKKRQTTGV